MGGTGLGVEVAAAGGGLLRVAGGCKGAGVAGALATAEGDAGAAVGVGVAAAVLQATDANRTSVKKKTERIRIIIGKKDRGRLPGS